MEQHPLTPTDREKNTTPQTGVGQLSHFLKIAPLISFSSNYVFLNKVVRFWDRKVVNISWSANQGLQKIGLKYRLE